MKTITIRNCLFLTLLLWLGPAAHCIEESMCFGVSYSHFKSNGLGLISMGASEWYGERLNTFWGAEHITQDKLKKRKDKPYLSITRVHGQAADGTRRVLNGWLQLTFSRLGAGKEFAAIAIWAVPENFEAYGQFMAKMPSDNCKGSEWKAAEFVPCSGTPINVPLNPNMFVWTRREHYNSSQLINKVHILWKADQSYCNSPDYFNFMFAVTTEDWNKLPIKQFGVNSNTAGARALRPMLYSSSRLRPMFYGMASPIFDRNELSCNSTEDSVSIQAEWMKQKADTKNGSLLDNVGKLWDTTRWNSGNSPVSKPQVLKLRQTCRRKTDARFFMDFGGRCNGTANGIKQTKFVEPSFDSAPQCRYDPMDTSIPEESARSNAFEKNGSGTTLHFKDYINVQRQLEVHKIPCDCPPIPTSDELKPKTRARKYEHVAWIDSTPYQEPERGCTQYANTPSYHKHGLCLQSVAGQYAHGVRQWHAITNLFCCIVLVPVSCFMARYLKGYIPLSHDTLKPHIPVRSWYIVHILLVLPVICMYASGMSAIRRQLTTLGHSRTAYAKFHRIGGFVIMALFGVQCVLGFLRPMNMTWRKIVIYIHWAFGYMVYYFGAVVCILTYRIPASPFSFHKVLDPKFSKVQYHVAPVLVICWVAIDLLAHISITLYIIVYERSRLGANARTYFPVLLPMQADTHYLRTHDIDDFPQEERCLNRIFYGYIVFCSCFFIFMLVAMSYLNLEQNHGYGPMQCTHNSKNLFTAGLGNVSVEELKIQDKFCKM